MLSCGLLCVPLLGAALPGRAETEIAGSPYQVVVLPYERDDAPRHSYLRRESPVIRVRFTNNTE